MIRFAFASTFLISLTMTIPASGQTIVDFNSLSGYSDFTASGNYFNGYGSGAAAGTWATDGVSFNTNQFGPGWSYSNVNDTVTAGFANQFAAITGTGIGGAGNYALANASSFGTNRAFFNLPTDHVVNSVFVTNATYPALSMQNGDAFAKEFGGPSGNDPDFFRVTFTGYSGLNASGATTGSQELFLADYRFANNALDFILDEWTFLDLSTLGSAQSVGLSLDGSDIGTFGLNTPAYLAIDNLAITAVPEPSSVLGLTAVALLVIRRRARQRREQRTSNG